MMTVDVQVYVWAAHTSERPWLEDGFGREHSPVPIMPEALLTQVDETGIVCAILMPPSREGDYSALAIKGGD